jgi:hypothetical protein
MQDTQDNYLHDNQVIIHYTLYKTEPLKRALQHTNLNLIYFQ